MKKFSAIFLISLLLVSAFVLTACGGDNDGTYYPTNEEIEENLSNAGYVTLFHDSQTGYGGYGQKNDEYIYFCRPKTESDCEYYYNLYKDNCKDYDVLVKIENDKKYGNVVYCATNNALNDAGIKVVNVEVKV